MSFYWLLYKMGGENISCFLSVNEYIVVYRLKLQLDAKRRVALVVKHIV